MEIDLKSERRIYEAGIRPSAEIGLALITRLEQAEARVKVLESGIVADLVITSVHSASAIGATVSGIAGELLKLGYDGLTDRLEKAEQDRDKLRNRLDAMRRQRDGYRNQLRKTEQQIPAMRAALEAIQEQHEELTVYEWDYDSGDFKLNSAGERIIVARLCLGCTPESIKEEIDDASYDAAGSYNDVHFPCATRRLADQGLGDMLASTTKNGDA